VHEHLLEQAVTLARLDARRPKQANLRRAISAAYYALFHLLVDEACRSQIGSLHDQAPQYLAPTDEKTFFLACLWAWKELANR
jgi:hypothetical protein